MSLVLVILLVLLLVAALPVFPHSAGWGYGPSGLLVFALLVVLILALTGYL